MKFENVVLQLSVWGLGFKIIGAAIHQIAHYYKKCVTYKNEKKVLED